MKSIKKYLLPFIILCFALVLVNPVQGQVASNVVINKSKRTIIVGQQKTLKVKNTTKKVKWSSSKSSVAKVNSQGIVTAKERGSATITAIVGKKKYKWEVTVKEKPSLSKKETICVGKKIKLKVEGTTQQVTWSSSNKKIVKVSKKGNIRGLKKGVAIITAKVGDKELMCKVRVKDAVVNVNRTISVQDSAFVTVAYLSDTISCKISDTEIATIAMTEGVWSEEGTGKEADIVIYGHKSGTAYITVKNNCNNEEMKFKVVVNKTEPATAKDKLVSYIVDHGDLSDDCNKYISKQYEENNASAKISYDYWEEMLDYEYTEISEKAEVKWIILGVDSPEDRYIVMWITEVGAQESQYVTVKTDMTAYNGETLVFEEAWFGIPVDDELQNIANSVTANAYEKMEELLKQHVELTFKEVL